MSSNNKWTPPPSLRVGRTWWRVRMGLAALLLAPLIVLVAPFWVLGYLYERLTGAHYVSPRQPDFLNPPPPPPPPPTK